MSPRKLSVLTLYSFNHRALLYKINNGNITLCLLTDYEIIKLILERDSTKGVIQDFRVPVTTLQYHRNAVGYL